MREQNVIKDKSMEFAVRIVRLYMYLAEKEHEYVMSKQVLRSGTSIGANVREAEYAQSRKDFISKMSVALKEAAETEYWIELLYRTEYLKCDAYESILADSQELCRILISIVNSSKT